jgi:hypothetical protein
MRNGPSLPERRSWGRLLPVRCFWEAHTGSANLTRLAGVSSYRRAYYLVLKGHALGIVFRKPGFRGVGIREDLEVIGVSDLLAGVDIDPDCHQAILAMQ